MSFFREINKDQLSPVHLDMRDREPKDTVSIRGFDSLEDFKEFEKEIGRCVLKKYTPTLTERESERLIGELHHSRANKFAHDKLSPIDDQKLSVVIGKKRKPSNMPAPRTNLLEVPAVRFYCVQEQTTPSPTLFNVVPIVLFISQHAKLRLCREIHPLVQFESLEHTQVTC